MIVSLLTEGTCSKCGRTNVPTSKIGTKEVCYFGCNNAPNQSPTNAQVKDAFKLTEPTQLVTSKQMMSYGGRDKFQGNFRYLNSFMHELTIQISSLEEGIALGFEPEGAQDILDDGGTFQDRFHVWVAFDLYRQNSHQHDIDGHQIVGLQYAAANIAVLSPADADQLDGLVDVSDQHEMISDTLERTERDSY